MKALILAGGKGIRLDPVVSDIPKPMAEVAGRPFLEWQLDFLAEYDVTDVVLSVGYKDEVIREHFGTGEGFPADIEYVQESEPLGTGGAVRKAQPLLASEDNFLVLNGDTYLDVNIDEFLAFHRRNAAVATLALSEVSEEKKGGFVDVTDDGQIEGFVEERRDGGVVNGGIRAMTPEVFTYMPEADKFNLDRVMADLAGSGLMFGFRTEGYFKDMGTPERYQEINEEIEEVVR